MYDIYQQSALGVKKCKVNSILPAITNHLVSIRIMEIRF